MCLVLPIFRKKNNRFAKECGTSMASQESFCQPIHLEPFIHQVGGSSSMLELDSSTICKPLISREQLFYENIPEFMKLYVADYRGVIEVRFVEDREGFLKVTAFASSDVKLTRQSSMENAKNSQQSSVTKCRIKVSRSGKVEIVSNPVASENTQIFDEDCVSENRRGSLHNPWVLHCHREQLSKIHDSNSSIVYTQKYILLENLTSKYHYPCVLDLKMGVRQYGDDAPLSKRLTQDAKVAATTSSKLGLRICGMQVYHLSDSHFLCHNKYYGRALTTDGFKQTLIQFLHNGKEMRKELLPPLIERLSDLESVISTLDTFRFFTSSLLIIYDGKDPSETNCNLNINLDENKKGKLSEELCCGAHNSNRLTAEELKDSNLTREDTTMGDNANEASEGSKCLTTNSSKFMTEPLPLVDVRMIDFAHSTFSEMPGDKIIHRGPDEGYLFGLENLIKQLKMIQKEISSP